jgi:hypothetical protein
MLPIRPCTSPWGKILAHVPQSTQQPAPVTCRSLGIPEKALAGQVQGHAAQNVPAAPSSRGRRDPWRFGQPVRFGPPLCGNELRKRTTRSSRQTPGTVEHPGRYDLPFLLHPSVQFRRFRPGLLVSSICPSARAAHPGAALPSDSTEADKILWVGYRKSQRRSILDPEYGYPLSRICLRGELRAGPRIVCLCQGGSARAASC